MNYNPSKQGYYPTQATSPVPMGHRPELWLQVTELLNQTLTATLDLKIQVSQAQQIEALNDYLPQEFLDEIVAVLDEYIDLFTTWLMALGRGASGNCSVARPLALPENLCNLESLRDRVTAFADRLVLYARALRSRSKLT